MSTKKPITFEMDEEEVENVDEFIDESFVFDGRSQFIRAAIRTYMAEESDEFSEAQ